MLAQENRHPAACRQRLAVEFQPTGFASARQPAFGDDDIGSGTGGDQVAPGNRVARSGGEQHPAIPFAIDLGEAAVAAAIGESLVGQQPGIAVMPRRLAHQAAHEVAALVAKNDRRDTGRGDGEVAAVPGDEQIGRRGQRSADRADRQRDQPEPARARGPQAEPQPAQDHRPKAPARHCRQAGDRAVEAADPMRQPEQPVDRPPRRGPQRCAKPDRIEQQRAGFQRHDHERRPRDGDQIGADSVQAGLVEMVERQRDQRDFDRQAGGDQRGDPAHQSAAEAIVARAEHALDYGNAVQRDDRGHRREA